MVRTDIGYFSVKQLASLYIKSSKRGKTPGSLMHSMPVKEFDAPHYAFINLEGTSISKENNCTGRKLREEKVLCITK